MDPSGTLRILERILMDPSGTIFDYLSLALGYVLQIWLTGLPFTIFAGLANSTTLHNWLLAILASLSIPSFPFLL